jgi:thiamine monophosphate kinase
MKFVLILALMATPAFAHHSATAAYFADRKVTVKGTLVKFLFRNPHAFVQVDGPDASGKMAHWTVEWVGTGQLGQSGITGQTLKAGDQVIVTGNLGRFDPHQLRMISIQRPSDGFRWGGTTTY